MALNLQVLDQMGHEKWMVATVDRGRPSWSRVNVVRGVGVLPSSQRVVHALADAVREGDVQKLDILTHALGPPPWIEDRDDLVVALGMVADPFPRD